MYLLDRCIDVFVPFLKGDSGAEFLWPDALPDANQNNKYLEMRLGASVALVFNSLAQGPVTRG